MHSNAVNTLKIENSSLSDETTTVSRLCSHFSKKLEESNLLVAGSFPRKKLESTGKFDDSAWVIYRNATSTYAYVEFGRLEEMIFINVSKQQINLIKSWLAKLFLDKKFYISNKSNVAITDVRTSENLITYFNHFINFLQTSNNFSKDFLDVDKGDKLAYYFTDLSLKMSHIKLNGVKKMILSYLRFSFIQHHITDKIHSYNLYPKYIERIENLLDDASGLIINGNTDDDDDSFHLPCSTDILKLNYYIDKFFKDKAIDEDIRLYYYPIYIWWKVTLVIPMRVSEITAKTPRDCISYNDKEDAYYLKIGRAKENFSKTNCLPLVTDFKITKEIYDVIDWYIKKTDKYGTAKTLFSYNAHLRLRNILGAKYPNFFPLGYARDEKGNFKRVNLSEDDIKQISNKDLSETDIKPTYEVTTCKYHDEMFSREIFNNLLASFYNKIVETYYEDTSIAEKLRANQTRHLAFSYLLLQGLPKVEIAIIGGHSDTKTIESYTYDNDVYIDTQVKVNVNKNLAKESVSEESLYDKVFSMPKECPIPKEDSVPTEFDGTYLGYCIASENTACESFKCYKCSHWYCEPKLENFRGLFEIIKKEISKEDDALHNSISLISKLIDNSAIINATDDELSFEKGYFQKMQQMGNKIKSNADKIIQAKTKLLESMLEKGVDYTELEIIDKLALLNQTFNKNTVFTE